MKFLLRLMRCMPTALNRLHLQWARAHLTRHNPFHRDLPYIVCEIARLEKV